MLSLSTVTSFSEKGFPENVKWPYIGDELKWNKCGSEEDRFEIEKQVIAILKRYLVDGKYSNNLKVYKSVAAGLFGNHIEIYSR